ncbi:unnamed protein product [Pseudo-nitzschia multistriata]|uniref:N-acetyltransferase domain-containing protein n=1 Tax=Pseudo-nitzschia multistriata TaxID=183589 RepID=A0A448ZH45_9STRA|nr:unnamed protein product [Pseudo-nitzschia multistriata]
MSDEQSQCQSHSESKALTDNPVFSSAALCVVLNHLGQSFRPEYTHQLVEGECWRGYRPIASVLRAANSSYEKSVTNGKEQQSSLSSSTTATTPDQSILHKSHGNHSSAASELEITVEIAPSCQTCCVEIKRAESKRDNQNCDDEPATKRLKTALDSVSRSEGNTSSPENITSLSCQAPMTDSEIIGALSKALPRIISANADVKKSFLSKPIGDIVEEYSIPATTQSENSPSASAVEFVLTVADGKLPEVTEYQDSVQKLSLFYIENADTVDVGKDGDGGFWKILYLFRKHTLPAFDNKSGCEDGDAKEKTKKYQFQYSLVGYVTLFHFNALFHKPEPGWILRICQALVLPPFQGQGHGKRLMQAVYSMAHCTNNTENAKSSHNIVQVNVEDPAPAFIALRNSMDWNLVREHHQEWNWPQKGSLREENSKMVAPADELVLFFSAMTEKEAMEVSTKARITPKQIHLTNELLKLQAVRNFLDEETVSSGDKEAIERYFRLMVKRRLNKDHRDELLELPSKDDQKARLAALFAEEVKGYERILTKG